MKSWDDGVCTVSMLPETEKESQQLKDTYGIYVPPNSGQYVSFIPSITDAEWRERVTRGKP